MPFKSRAQQRFMFAQHPRIAKRWAKKTPDIKNLPEETVKKTASEGLFFEKRAKAGKGHFFRDLPGRDGADFHKQGMGAMGVTPTGAPMIGSGNAGAGLGALYGTGEGKDEKKKKTPGERVKEHVEKAKKESPEAAAKEEAPTEEAKEAAWAPSDWESGGAPSGAHRPARTQPGNLEAGGERFHSKDSVPFEGEPTGTPTGLVEGGRQKRRGSAGHQMGKHASAAPPRFLGTSFEKNALMDRKDYEGAKGWIGDRSGDAAAGAKAGGKWMAGKGEDAIEGAKRAKKWLGGKAQEADKGFSKALRHPAGGAAAVGLTGLAGLALLGKGRHLASRALGLTKKTPKPQGLIGKIKQTIAG